MDSLQSVKNHILFGSAIGAPQFMNDEIKGLIVTIVATIVSSISAALIESVKRRFKAAKSK